MQTRFLCALAPLFLASTLCGQKTYDLSQYLLLQPGSYRLTQERKPGQSPTRRWGTVTQRLGRFTVHYEYALDLQNRILRLDAAAIFEVTPTHLVFYGTYDFTTATPELLTPPLRIPRQLALGKPFVYTGLAKGRPWTLVITIVRDQVSYTSPTRRTFRNGLQVSFLEVEGGNLTVTTDLLAPAQKPNASAPGMVFSLSVDLHPTLPDPPEGAGDPGGVRGAVGGGGPPRPREWGKNAAGMGQPHSAALVSI